MGSATAYFCHCSPGPCPHYKTVCAECGASQADVNVDREHLDMFAVTCCGQDAPRAELVPLETYLSYRRRRDKRIGLSYALGDREAQHLAAVRQATERREIIHAVNKIEYRRYLPALAWYSMNGNLAVYDASMRAVFPTHQHVLNNRHRNHELAVAMSEAEARKKVA